MLLLTYLSLRLALFSLFYLEIRTICQIFRNTLFGMGFDKIGNGLAKWRYDSLVCLGLNLCRKFF